MAFTIYRSSDASAPAMTGQVGSLVALLDACLVNGYGAKSAAGWTKPYSDSTHTGVYRPDAGTRFYLRVNDNGPGAGTYKEARVVGYETMSDVNTGTNAFPTAAQMATQLFVRKSVALDATARDWIVLADSRTMYCFIKSEVAVGAAGVYMCFTFGDFYSLVPSDLYNCILIARITENSTSSTTAETMSGLAATVGTTASGGHYVTRPYTGLGGSLPVNKFGNPTFGGSQFAGTLPFPNASDGGIYQSRVWIGDPATAPQPSVRGRMRGLWATMHPIASFADGDTFNGTGDLAGRAFMFIKSAGNNGIYCTETSDTLETN